MITKTLDRLGNANKESKLSTSRFHANSLNFIAPIPYNLFHRLATLAKSTYYKCIYNCIEEMRLSHRRGSFHAKEV